MVERVRETYRLSQRPHRFVLGVVSVAPEADRFTAMLRQVEVVTLADEMFVDAYAMACLAPYRYVALLLDGPKSTAACATVDEVLTDRGVDARCWVQDLPAGPREVDGLLRSLSRPW